MDLIRIIGREFYDPNRGRFQSWAFGNSSGGGGISVIHRECMVETSGTVCRHIQEYYADLGEDDPVFWRLSKEDLPADCELEQQDGPKGDKCHYNIMGLSDNRAGRLFKQLTMNLQNMYHCDGDQERPLSVKDLAP
jgi:hypothetical protein